jgi:hypothetical protein
MLSVDMGAIKLPGEEKKKSHPSEKYDLATTNTAWILSVGANN